jgi:two-component system cell cycle response regulator
MAGRILILDSVATNRIVLKVKMAAAQYDVQGCATHSEAMALIDAQCPDLILINMSDPVEDRYAFCKNLRQNIKTESIGIICLGVADTARARFAAIDCGANDVLPRPISDTLMMARVRSILRQRNIGLEWKLREDACRALGFEEEGAPMLRPINAALLVFGNNQKSKLQTTVDEAIGQNVTRFAALLSQNSKQLPNQTELLVADASAGDVDPQHLFQMIADLKTRPETRLAAQLIIVAQGQEDTAAMCLDLGAEDVVFANASAGELKLRIKTLMLRKSQRDKMNNSVLDGLHAAVTDPLTGLHNRRYADMHLVKIAEQARTTGHEFALMMIDIDFFKAINDSYGHAAGDDVLKALSDRLRQNLRSIDLLARIGGEEFMIVMPDTTSDLAEMAADRLRQLINDRPFRIPGNDHPLQVTVSVGVAVDQAVEPHGFDASRLIGQADAALYAAKAGGRNMVSVSHVAA